jgi:acetyltransferase-like isoleucine patch superfamily enzyme
MKFSKITLGENVEIDPSTSFNNVNIGSNVKIAKRCSIFGSPQNPVQIHESSYVGMNTIINGFAESLVIGAHVSIAQNVNIMVDSGPNASPAMQALFPLEKGPVYIGDHSWIGASAIIMPGVTLGRYCIVAANSYVNNSFADYSIIGGTPAKLIRVLNEEEIGKLTAVEEQSLLGK